MFALSYDSGPPSKNLWLREALGARTRSTDFFFVLVSCLMMLIHFGSCNCEQNRRQHRKKLQRICVSPYICIHTPLLPYLNSSTMAAARCSSVYNHPTDSRSPPPPPILLSFLPTGSLTPLPPGQPRPRRYHHDVLSAGKNQKQKQQQQRQQ